jgi:hypothetical protein
VPTNGKYVVLPVWVRGDKKYGELALPNPHANSSIGDTQQQYPHGTKFVDGARTFYYGKVASVTVGNKANIGLFNTNEHAAGTGTVTWGATAGVKGDTKVGILASSLTDTTPAVNDFAGGWFMPRTNPYSSYPVIASSVSGASVSGEVDLYLDYGLVEAVSQSQASCFLNFSEWTALRQEWAAGSDLMTCPGVTLIDPIAATWQWVQSWGPCYVVPYNEEIGALVNVHQAAFHIDGTIKAVVPTSTYNRQLAGYLINDSGPSSTSSWLVRLQVNN